MKKNKEFKDLSKDELSSKINEFKEELLSLRFKSAKAQLTNTMSIRKLKRSIAVLKTILTQKYGND